MIGPVEAIDGSSLAEWSGTENIDFKKARTPALASPCWACFCCHLCRHYFYRIWIIQEVLANSRCFFQCGERTFSREFVLQVGAMLHKFVNLRFMLMLGPLETN
jgi:hypothetical protein